MKVLGRLAAALLITIFTANAWAGDVTVLQKNKMFVKNGAKLQEMTVKLGDTIHFKNADPFFHNIFSLSDIKTFDLGSYTTGKSKSVTMDKAGISEIECAIHPHMFLTVKVKK